MQPLEKKTLNDGDRDPQATVPQQLICSCGFDEFRVYQDPPETFIECLVCQKTYSVDQK